MSKYRHHSLDIYDAELYLATTRKQWAAIRREHKGAELHDPDSDGVCYLIIVTEAGRSTPHLFVFINAKVHTEPHDLAATCAHEATHAAAQLLDHIGQAGGDSEALAYLVGWLTRWMLDGAA